MTIGNRPSGAVALAATAMLFATLSQHLSSRQSELYSEILCWITLPFLFRITKYFDLKHSNGKSEKDEGLLAQQTPPETLSGSAPATHRRPLIMVTFGIVTASIYRTEFRLIQLYPLLTPLLLLYEQFSEVGVHPPRSPEPAWRAIWETIMIAVLSNLALPNRTLLGSTFSVLPTLALYLLYISLKSSSQVNQEELPRIVFEDEITSISMMAVFTLLFAFGVQGIVFGLPDAHLIRILTMGLMKAITWKLTASMAGISSWRIATSIWTFSLLANVDPLSYGSDTTALSSVVASMLAICQIIGMLPTSAIYRKVIWAFALIPLASYSSARTSIIMADLRAQTFDHPGNTHPVESLIATARLNYEELVTRQSRDFDAASAEYRRRYGMEPPPGFEGWFELAISHNSSIIDDFDAMHGSVSPFWRLSGLEVLESMKEAYATQNSELWRCSFSSGSAKTSCRHKHRSFDRHIASEFDDRMASLKGKLPDVTFLVNHFDEATVLVPPLSRMPGDDFDKDPFRMTYMSKTSIWDAITNFCTPETRSNDRPLKQYKDTSGLFFVTNCSFATDLCQHSEFSSLHGFLQSPTSFRLFEGLVPIMSTSAPSVMGDILFPSPAYSEDEFQYDESRDEDWAKKRNELYWTGSTTGGFAHDDGWSAFHRQRFVTMVENTDHKQRYFYLEEEEGQSRLRISSFLNRRLFNVGFTNVVGCDRKHCRDQRTFFNLRAWADKDEALGSRLGFDIDGNGISGRYYKLLASKSAPFKMTIFREWHDDRLVPWYHYIPVSLSMEELPELVMYFTSTESGRRRAEEIASQGREWYSKAFRDVDKTIYLYRLFLELARLQDPAREATDQ